MSTHSHSVALHQASAFCQQFSARFLAALVLCTVAFTACGEKAPPEITKKIECAHDDISVTITKVTHDRNAGRSTVNTTFTVKCKGAAVTTGYQARTKITKFTDEVLRDASPDAAGSAKVGRVDQQDPSGQEITVTVKSTDGTEVTSSGATVPNG